jgi:large subunit ribosomal protein L4
MKVAVLSVEGKEVRSVDVDETVFGITPNIAVLHQAYVAQRNNQRHGTASTKTRGEVQGSTRKIRRQKYTGRARQGSARSPVRVGGGTVFGPRPRSYTQALNKKMRRLAIRSALSGKLADGQLVVVDELALEQPQTKEIMRILGNVGITRSALIVTAKPDRTVLLSARNLERTAVLPANHLNVVDMMNHAGLLMTEEAVRVAETLWGKKEEAPRPKSAPKAAAKAAPKPRTRPKAETAVAEAPVEAEPEAAAEPAPPEKPKRAPRAKKGVEATAEQPEVATETVAAETAAEKPARKPRAAAKKTAEAPAEVAAEAAPEKPARKPRATAKKAPAAEGAPEAAEAEKKPRARRATKKEEGS